MNIKWIYWGATGLLALMYAGGGAMYLTNLGMVQGMFETFGYPAYLVPLLAVAKLAAVVVILWRFSVPLSDLAYAGMFFHLLLAASAHLGVGDYAGAPPSIIGLVLLLVSFFTQNSVRRKASPYGSLAALRS
jgi:small basic protein